MRASLTITGRLRPKLLASLLAASVLGGCERTPETREIVDPANHTAFYLWSGVVPDPAMARAKAVYLHWGELRRGDADSIVVVRRTVPEPPPDAELWLVVRAERLDWGEAAYDTVLAAARRWDRAGQLTGIQVDFDASTPQLSDYAAFLSRFRARLPVRWRLSATGLMDWPANASQADLARIAEALDEIVVQTYRDTQTVPDYRTYLRATERLDLPFRVAIMDGAQWREPDHLRHNPDYLGTVVFLR